MNAKIVLNLLAMTIVVISIVESHKIVTPGLNDAMITRLSNSFVATTESSMGRSFILDDEDNDRWVREQICGIYKEPNWVVSRKKWKESFANLRIFTSLTFRAFSPTYNSKDEDIVKENGKCSVRLTLDMWHRALFFFSWNRLMQKEIYFLPKILSYSGSLSRPFLSLPTSFFFIIRWKSLFRSIVEDKREERERNEIKFHQNLHFWFGMLELMEKKYFKLMKNSEFNSLAFFSLLNFSSTRSFSVITEQLSRFSLSSLFSLAIEEEISNLFLLHFHRDWRKNVSSRRWWKRFRWKQCETTKAVE